MVEEKWVNPQKDWINDLLKSILALPKIEAES